MTFRKAHAIVGGLIVAAWLAAMGRLAAREVEKHVSAPDKSVSELLSAGGADTHTYGVYHGDAKIGFAASRRIKAPGGWLFLDQAVWQLNLQGSTTKLVSETQAVVGDDFRLRSFDANVKTGVVDLEAKGTITGRTLSLDFVTGGKSYHDEQTIDADPLLPALVRAQVAARDPKPGTSYKLPIFNPLARGMEDVDVVVEGKETIATAAGSFDCWRMREILRGSIETTVWIDAAGDTIRELSPTGMKIEIEPRDKALTMPDASSVPDLILTAAVPVKGDLERQVDQDFVHVRLTGIDPKDFPLLDGGRQKLDGDVLSVSLNDPADYPLPYPGGDLAADLAAEPLIQSTDPDIVHAARKVVGGRDGARVASRELWKWLFDDMRKVNVAGVPSAIEVLQTMEGDCNEHTTLYVALARAIGLPSRMAIGLVWANARGGGPGLYYHAWPEVYLGRVGAAGFGGAVEKAPGWYAVDPTLGQFPADAGHLRFLVGGLDQQVDLLKLMGKLQVEVVTP